MNTARYVHTATLLPNGKTLVAGGWRGTSASITTSAELYDPADGTWTNTGAMTAPRTDHRATLFAQWPGAGRKGDLSSSTWLSSAELYDPATGMWTATGSIPPGVKLRRRLCSPTERFSWPPGHPLEDAADLPTRNCMMLAWDTAIPGSRRSPPSPHRSCWAGNLTLTGSGFRGISEASGGTAQGSPPITPSFNCAAWKAGNHVPAIDQLVGHEFHFSRRIEFPARLGAGHGIRQRHSQHQQHRQYHCPRSNPAILTGATTQPDARSQIRLHQHRGSAGSACWRPPTSRNP